jgi:hypothetical protein
MNSRGHETKDGNHMQAGSQVSLTVALRAAGCALAFLVCGSASDSAAASRDWGTNPAIIQLDTTEDVFAIGDRMAIRNGWPGRSRAQSSSRMRRARPTR